MNDPHTTSARPLRLWWLAVLSAILGVCVISLFFKQPRSNSATVLTDRSAFENRVAKALNAIPTGPRSFLRKLKAKLLGPAKLVLLDVFVVQFPAGSTFPMAKELDVRGNDARLRMFAIPATNSESFRTVLAQIKGSHVLSSRQMSAFSGQLAQLSSFANPVPGIYQGHSVDVLPRAGDGGVDLAIHAEALAPILSNAGNMSGTATNVLASVRVDVSPHTGALIVPVNSSGASTGVFVLPTIFRLKR